MTEDDALGLLLLRGAFWLNRFRSAPRAERSFRSVQGHCILARELFGFKFELDVSRSTTQKLIYLEGERFIEERHLLGRLVKPGMTVVDVGANIGYYLLLFQRCLRGNGRLVCVEPSKENLPELRRTIEINEFRNVTLHEAACGNEEGSVGLRSGINSGVVQSKEGTYEVRVCKLDNLVVEKIDFIKIDVEGYEGQVLEGADGLLRRWRPTLFLELHPHIVVRFGHTIKDIYAYLRDMYPHTTIYSRKAHEEERLWDKVACRYLGRDPITAVEDHESYLARYADGRIPHTFWVVCRA